MNLKLLIDLQKRIPIKNKEFSKTITDLDITLVLLKSYVYNHKDKLEQITKEEAVKEKAIKKRGS